MVAAPTHRHDEDVLPRSIVAVLRSVWPALLVAGVHAQPAAPCRIDPFGAESIADRAAVLKRGCQGERIDYESSPPAAGPHWAQFLFGGQVRKFWSTDDRPPIERLVHSLEHGYTILWYDESIADDPDELNVIDGIADKFRSDSNNLRYKFIAAPWTSQDEKESGKFPDGMHVAFSHWSAGGSGHRHLQAGRRVPVLQAAERRGPARVHAEVPLHGLARAGRHVRAVTRR